MPLHVCDSAASEESALPSTSIDMQAEAELDGVLTSDYVIGWVLRLALSSVSANSIIRLPDQNSPLIVDHLSV